MSHLRNVGPSPESSVTHSTAIKAFAAGPLELRIDSLRPQTPRLSDILPSRRNRIFSPVDSSVKRSTCPCRGM